MDKINEFYKLLLCLMCFLYFVIMYGIGQDEKLRHKYDLKGRDVICFILYPFYKPFYFLYWMVRNF